MIRSVKNVLMTIRNVLTLRNLLALLCTAALVAVIIKGFRIEDKIRQVRLADRYYAQHERLLAEAAYAAALENTVIRYQDGHIRARLSELTPITRMRAELLKSKSELLAALEKQDFENYLTAYEVYALFGRQSLEGEYAAEYNELIRRYDMAEIAAQGFADFRARFEQSLADNLAKGEYGDESAKWSLLQIPAIFFAEDRQSAAADEKAEALKSEHLSALFRDYDQRKLKKLAAAGRYTDMLREASGTLDQYRQNSYEAPWVQLQAEETSGIVLRRDLEAESYPDFAAHARSFADFASQNSLSSKLSAWIEARVNELLRRADSMVADGRFEEGLNLYKAVDSYSDTDARVARAEEAWIKADPLRMLQLNDASHTYKLAISGKHRFGANVYIAAVDENGTIYFGMDGDGGTSVWSDSAQLANETVRNLKLDSNLSNESQPVIVAEAESTSRQATYIGLIPQQGGSFTQMFRFEADGYTVEDGGMTLRVDNPSDAEQTGQIAIYTRYPDSDAFVFSEFEGGYQDIGSASPLLYPQQRVRAQVTVSQNASGQALARTGDGELILLKGNFDFAAGIYLMTGTFRDEYEQVEDPAAEPDLPESRGSGEADGQNGEPGSGSAETTSPAPDEPPGSQSDPAAEPDSNNNAPDSLQSDVLPEPTMLSVPVFEVEAVEPS